MGANISRALQYSRIQYVLNDLHIAFQLSAVGEETIELYLSRVAINSLCEGYVCIQAKWHIRPKLIAVSVAWSD